MSKDEGKMKSYVGRRRPVAIAVRSQKEASKERVAETP